MIPAGHMLMLSPYWSHRNSDYFPDAESFKPVSINEDINICYYMNIIGPLDIM